MQTIAETFSGIRPWTLPGKFFKLMSTVNPVDVTLWDEHGEPNKALQVEAGFYSRVAYRRIEITTAALELVKFVTSDEDAGNDSIIQIAERSVKFTASGSYIVPAGVTMLEVVTIGPGGGGGGGHTAAGGGGGGGGGSSLPMTAQLPVTPGETLLIYLYAGGVGGAAGAAAAAVTSNALIRRSAAGSAVVVAPSGGAGSTGTATNGGAGGACGNTFVLAAGGVTGVGAGANGAGFTPVDTGLWRAHGGGGGGAGGGPSAAGGNGGNSFGATAILVASYLLSGGNGGPAAGADGGGGGGGSCPFSRSGRGVSADVGEAAYGYGGGGGGGAATKAGGNGGDSYMIIRCK